VDAGYATQERVVQDARPDKTVYAITDRGRETLREWVEQAPLDAGHGRNLLLLKLYFGEDADQEALRRQLRERREDAQRLLSELDELEEAGAGGSPYQALTRRWGFIYGEALQRWTEEAEAALASLAESAPTKPRERR
jgi:hypothetical protein